MKKRNLKQKWAEFRFGVIGSLLSSPPEKGELQSRLRELSQIWWQHPVTGEPKQIGLSTIERWYYKTLKDPNPIEKLKRKTRSDMGKQITMTSAISTLLLEQYKAHASWSYKLHADNLEIVVEQKMPSVSPPSYSTVLRFMQSHGLEKRKRKKGKFKPGMAIAFDRHFNRETRSFESECAHSLWHLDFHFGSEQILKPDGSRATPVCLCILDDRTRLACHVQWYLSENTENLIHGFNQALQKRGFPRELMSDNGSAMKSEEFTQGLKRISIVHTTTLPYSPHQNGKQEVFWGQLEGRLVAMLENVDHLSLKFLNDATHAWVEMEYNREKHDALHMSPLQALMEVKDVSRPSLSGEALRSIFLKEEHRIQRKTDGTISVESKRFEIPSMYRHIKTVQIRYAKWDLSNVFLLDPETGKILCPIWPLDKTKNATSGRRARDSILSNSPMEKPKNEIAPLLKKYMEEFADIGLPPAYMVQNKEDQ